MEFNLSTVLVFITGLLAGGVAALKIIAPRTANKYDDKALEYGELALSVLPKPDAVAAPGQRPPNTVELPAATAVVLRPR